MPKYKLDIIGRGKRLRKKLTTHLTQAPSVRQYVCTSILVVFIYWYSYTGTEHRKRQPSSLYRSMPLVLTVTWYEPPSSIPHAPISWVRKRAEHLSWKDSNPRMTFPQGVSLMYDSSSWKICASIWARLSSSSLHMCRHHRKEDETASSRWSSFFFRIFPPQEYLLSRGRYEAPSGMRRQVPARRRFGNIYKYIRLGIGVRDLQPKPVFRRCTTF